MPIPRFEIEKRSKIDLEIPQMTCDTAIHPQIKPPLPGRRGAFFMVICGIPGSGKTSCMVSLLSSRDAYRKAYDNVFVVMPSHSASSLKRNPFEGHDKMYDELTMDTLETILESAKAEAEKKHNSLLILDDVTADLKNRDIQQLFKQIIYNRRHYRLSVWLLVQTYNSIPLSLRKTITHGIFYKPRNKKEYNAVFQELIMLPQDTAEALQRFVFQMPHDFMYLDCETSTFHRNFDGIRIKDGDEAEEDPKSQKAS